MDAVDRAADAPPLVVHLLYRFDFGGMEVLVSECVNRFPAGRYRHAIVCLEGYTAFTGIISSEVKLYSLDKKPGLGLSSHLHFYRLLRELRPAVVHTYNVAGVEYAVTAALAGVPVRVHAEHGRHAGDIKGTNRRHNLLRKAMRPFIDMYVTVSRDLHGWLEQVIRIPHAKNQMIMNGVDTARFHPAQPPGPKGGLFVIGVVSRITEVKNHDGLIDGFIRLRELAGDQATRLRLCIVGDGPLLARIRQRVTDEGLADVVELTGASNEVARVLQGFTVFALPSYSEGTPVAMLEAMATGLPVIGSTVGGVPDVVVDGQTGALIPPGDSEALARALLAYVLDAQRVGEHGARARERVQQSYSVHVMVDAYVQLYDTLCQQKIGPSAGQPRPQCAE